MYKKVQVGNDQEKAQPEKDSHSKNRGGKKTNNTKTMNTFSKPNEQLFPNRWPLSYLNLTKLNYFYVVLQAKEHQNFET